VELRGTAILQAATVVPRGPASQSGLARGLEKARRRAGRAAAGLSGGHRISAGAGTESSA